MQITVEEAAVDEDDSVARACRDAPVDENERLTVDDRAAIARAKEGPFVLRLKFPAGFVVPPHRHSKDEFVTVIAGSFAIGAGEKVDRSAVRPLPPASFVHLPAGMAHFAYAEVESVVQINGVGPFDVVYVDPKDDPRKK